MLPPGDWLTGQVVSLGHTGSIILLPLTCFTRFAFSCLSDKETGDFKIQTLQWQLRDKNSANMENPPILLHIGDIIR